MNLYRLFLFSTGSVIVACSAALGVMFSYEGNLPFIALSLAFFLLGFKISEVSVTNDFKPRKLVSREKDIRFNRVLFLLAGIVIASFGLNELGASISSEELWRSVTGGLYLVISYPLIHYGMEREIL